MSQQLHLTLARRSAAAACAALVGVTLLAGPASATVNTITVPQDSTVPTTAQVLVSPVDSIKAPWSEERWMCRWVRILCS